MFEIFNGFDQFDAIWEIIRGNDPDTNQIILCTLIDYVAGQIGLKGSELVEYLMPLLQEVNDIMGVAV